MQKSISLLMKKAWQVMLRIYNENDFCQLRILWHFSCDLFNCKYGNIFIERFLQYFLKFQIES